MLVWTGLLLAILLAISWIDFQQLIIPDWLNALLAGLGVVRIVSVNPAGIWSFFTGAIMVLVLTFGFRIVFFKLQGRQGLGLGDVKFLGAAAFWVELIYIPWVLLIASLSGLVYVIISYFLGKRQATETRLPFGPFLCLGLFIAWLRV